MKTRRDHRLLLVGAILLSAFFTTDSLASNEALTLAIPASSPGGITHAQIGIKNPADVESFSLRLSFASGGILSLPLEGWFVRGGYFPSSPFGPSPRVELNQAGDGAARTKIILDGFDPQGKSGYLGRVTLKVANTAVVATTDTPADTQIVTVSGEFWSRAEQTRKTLAPVSAEFKTVEGDNDGDGIGDAKDQDDDNDGVPDALDSRPKDAAFRGSEQTTAAVDYNWSTVTLPTLFSNPVVIAGPPSYHNAKGGVPRLRNLTDGTFETRFQEWDYLNGEHPEENIPYLVLEIGRQTMADGSVWETGIFPLDGTGSWKSQHFDQPFAKTPQLFLTLQTANEGQAVTVRAKQVTTKGFQAALFEQESKMPSGHAEETVGYLAVYSPTGSGEVNIGGKNQPYLVQQPTVDERWTPVLSSSLSLQEETSGDADTDHGDEKLSVLALGKQLYAQDITSLDVDPVALRCKPPEYKGPVEWGVASGISIKWATIPLAKTYTHPVIVAKLAQQSDSDPGVVRQRGVSSDSFQARFQEWDYLDGKHGAERIFYLVAEQGSFELAGLQGEAGLLKTDKLLQNGTTKVTYTQAFTEIPGVFSSVMSFANADTVITRIKNSALKGFNIAMQKQESKTDGHPKETLGWIALERGTGLTGDKRRIEILDTVASNKPTTVDFNQEFKRRFPILLQDLNSSNDIDPAIAAQKGLTASQVQVYVQEEKSKDTEVAHGSESVSVFAAE